MVDSLENVFYLDFFYLIFLLQTFKNLNRSTVIRVLGSSCHYYYRFISCEDFLISVTFPFMTPTPKI